MSPLRLSLLALVVVCLTSLGLASCARPAGCQRNSDCHKSYCAADGECKKDCIDEKLDCPAGWTCDETARCVAPPGWVDPGDGGTAGSGAGGGQGGQGDGDGGDAGNGGQGGSGGGGSGGGGSGGGAGGSGGGGTVTHAFEACSNDSDCTAPAICREMYKGGPFRCTAPCAGSQPCPSGTRCEYINGESYCAQIDIGKPCASDTVCNYTCITDPGYCTSLCTDGRDCPNGFGCSGGLCVKVNIYCGAGYDHESCGPAICNDPDIYDDSEVWFASCTIPCGNYLDCPQRAQGLAAWTCDGACRRPQSSSIAENLIIGPLSGGKQAEYICTNKGAVTTCGDAMHMNFNTFAIPPRPSGAYCSATYPESWMSSFPNPNDPYESCVDSCRFQGGCPFGFVCSGVGSLGSGRIGLCLPSGTGDIGAPCSRDTDCGLGYCHVEIGKCTRDCSADLVCPKGFTCTPDPKGSTVEGNTFRRCL